jgi:hypothetical protein
VSPASLTPQGERRGPAPLGRPSCLWTASLSERQSATAARTPLSTLLTGPGRRRACERSAPEKGGSGSSAGMGSHFWKWLRLLLRRPGAFDQQLRCWCPIGHLSGYWPVKSGATCREWRPSGTWPAAISAHVMARKARGRLAESLKEGWLRLRSRRGARRLLCHYAL